jgi:hypothetical protein
MTTQSLVLSSKKKGFFLRRFFIPVQKRTFLIEMFILCKHEREVTVRCGFLGDTKPGAWEERLPLTRVNMGEKSISIDGDRFVFSDTFLSGTMADKKATWRIELGEREVVTGKHRGLHWLACPAPPLYSGSLTVNEDNYTLPDTEASPFWDSLWGDEWPQKWFYLCGMNLKSDMSHRQLERAFFLVQGVFGKKLTLTVQIGEERVIGDHRGDFNCTQVGNDVHWTVSIKHRGTIIDIDVSSVAETMRERCYDSPSTSKRLLLQCGTARANNADRAEIHILRPVAKTLELIEFAHSDCTITECGNLR